MPPNPQGKTKYKKQIVTLFESLERTARPEFRPKIRKLTELYKERRISNYKTAYNAILKLASSNKNVLRGAENTYNKLIAKYPEPAPPETPRITIVVTERDLTNPSKAKGFANYKIITADETKDEKGCETVGYGEVIRKVEPFLIHSITKALSIKQTMKMSLRLNLEIAKYEVDADGEEHESKEHLTIRTSSHAVRQSNIREIALELLNLLLINMENISERVQGSNWRIKKYHYISADMDKTKPSRASSYIPTPAKYQHSRCGLINIKNLDDNKQMLLLLYVIPPR